jgi:hypothetical protein
LYWCCTRIKSHFLLMKSTFKLFTLKIYFNLEEENKSMKEKEY